MPLEGSRWWVTVFAKGGVFFFVEIEKWVIGRGDEGLVVREIL